MWPNPKETADLVRFTEETLNGKLYFLCSVMIVQNVISTRHKLMFSSAFGGN